MALPHPFPELVEKERFLNAAVKTILTEFANRRALIREAELPEWLVEGLTAELAATSLPMLALEPAAEVNRRGQNPDALAEVRELLRQRTPLSFDDLSMPDDNMLAGESAARFRACAHLFVHELLHLRDGRACLRRMLERLPDNLNWQTTFLQSFENHFSSLLDVDQWYALSVAGIRGRDPSSIFPPETTRQQLDGILATSVEVRVAAQELPLRMDLKLQRLIAEWEFPRQHAVLVEKISRLQTLKNRAAPEMLDAVNGYLDALLEYVGSRNLAPPRTDRQRERLRPRGTAGKLIEQLDRLDARRLPEVAPPR